MSIQLNMPREYIRKIEIESKKHKKSYYELG